MRDDIQKGLEQDTRLVAEHIPQKMTGPEIEKIATSLKQFMTDNEFSQAQVAKLIGYSRSVVSEFLKGRYQGDLNGIANKIINLMNSVVRKNRRVKNKPFVSTTVAKRIGTLITQTSAFCDDEGKIGLIIGDGGHGKSHCLRQYAEADKNSVYIELDDTMSSISMFSEIAKNLKVDSSGSLSSIAKRLVAALKLRHIIIMLDEASWLKVRHLNQLRQIIVVKAKCPLILSGNSDLLRTISQSSTKRGYESLDQFTSRLMGVLNLDELASDNDGGLYTVEDIRNLYEYGGIRLTSSAVSSLKRICKTPKSGRLRTCSHIVSALHAAKVVDEKRVIDTVEIIAVIDQLKLPIREWLPLIVRDTQRGDELTRVVVSA
ncbi:AAA family ATPase [Candidatus Pacearchaeota archaeon]|nr:AAA family ATPase [Candidatus Pacearchaeota archaeon]